MAGWDNALQTLQTAHARLSPIWDHIWQCCNTPPADLVIDTANGEMEVQCKMDSRSLSSLLWCITKGNRQSLPVVTLDIHGSSLSLSALRRLAQAVKSAKHVALRELNFANCLDFTDRGGVAAPAIDRGSCQCLSSCITSQNNLTILNLSGLRLNAAHLSILVPALSAPLRELDLSGNRLSNQAAVQLFKLRHRTLCRVYLHDNRITQDVVLDVQDDIDHWSSLEFLSVFSRENCLDLFKDREEAERRRQRQVVKQAEADRVVHRVEGMGFFRPLINDTFQVLPPLQKFDPLRGLADFGAEVSDKPHVTWIFPKMELTEKQIAPGLRCIAEYTVGGSQKLGYSLCEIHELEPLQVRFSTRVVNPLKPDQPEGRAFNRVRTLESDTFSQSKSVGSANAASSSSSNILSHSPSRMQDDDEGESWTPAGALPAGKRLTGKMFACPSAYQTSYAEKERVLPTSSMDVDYAFSTAEALLEFWGVPREKTRGANEASSSKDY